MSQLIYLNAFQIKGIAQGHKAETHLNLEHDTLFSAKYWFNPGRHSDRKCPYMSENLLTGMLSINTNKNALQTNFIMDANTMSPDQTDLGSYCLQYRLQKRSDKWR